MVQYSVPTEHNVWVSMSVVLLVVNICLTHSFTHSLTIQFERQQFTTVAQHSRVETGKADTGIRLLNGLDIGTYSLNPAYCIAANFCVVLCGSMRKGSQSLTKNL